MRRPVSPIMGSVEAFSSKAISHVPLKRKEVNYILYPTYSQMAKALNTSYSSSCNLGSLFYHHLTSEVSPQNKTLSVKYVLECIVFSQFGIEPGGKCKSYFILSKHSNFKM